MLILKIIIPIITYALIIYLCFRLYKRYYDRISSYIDETTDNWYDLPNWMIPPPKCVSKKSIKRKSVL